MDFDDMFFDIIDSSPLEFTPYRTSVRDALSLLDGYYEINPPSALDRMIYGFFKIYDMYGHKDIDIEDLKNEMPGVERFALKTPIRMPIHSTNYFMGLVSGQDFRNAAVLAILPSQGEYQNLMLFTISANPMCAWDQFKALDIGIKKLANNPQASPFTKEIPGQLGNLFIISYLQTLSYLNRGMYSLLPV
jgi:hypothetical protein